MSKTLGYCFSLEEECILSLRNSSKTEQAVHYWIKHLPQKVQRKLTNSSISTHLETCNLMLKCTHLYNTILFHPIYFSLDVESLHLPITGKVLEAANIEIAIVFYNCGGDSSCSLLWSIDSVTSSRNAPNWLLANLAGGGLGWPSAVKMTVNIVTASRAKVHSDIIISRKHWYCLCNIDEIILWSTREEHWFENLIDIRMHLSPLIEKERMKWRNRFLTSKDPIQWIKEDKLVLLELLSIIYLKSCIKFGLCIPE